jgi:hypothetical protein
MDLLNKQDCKDLAHSSCNSFYDARKDEFEILKNKQVPTNKDSIMLFYDAELTALLCYNFFKKEADVSLVWREVAYTIGKKKWYWFSPKPEYSEEWIIVLNCLKKKKNKFKKNKS